jgi:osmotically-inducible protein OsmY
MMSFLLLAAAASVSVPREFVDAWDRITLGNEVQAQVGEWTLENAGPVLAWRRLELVGGKAMTDDRIRARVRKRLAETFPRQNVDVRVSHGIVALHGRMKSREAAGRALYATLRVSGVEEVRSFLVWPGPGRIKVASPNSWER